MKITATIITFNEDKNLARCLRSLDFCDEIIVVDSYSSDRSVQIAREHGAKVFSQGFLGYGQQKNFASQQSSNDWIFSIDADEEVSVELKEEILKIKETLDDKTIYQINRRTSFCDQWIYHGGWYPDILTRLYNRKSAQWTNPKVHEEVRPNDSQSKIVKFKGHLNHYSFPSIESQIQTNVKYAKLGAKKLLNNGKRPGMLTVFLRAWWKFVECYFIKSGWLDGKAGLIIAINASYSQFMKYIFTYRENQIKKAN